MNTTITRLRDVPDGSKVSIAGVLFRASIDKRGIDLVRLNNKGHRIKKSRIRYGLKCQMWVDAIS